MKLTALYISLLLFSGIAFADSTVHTFVGTGTKGFSGDDGVAMQAQINDPTGISRGRDGALYICDTANHRIRKISPDGTITTVAGTGEPGWSGDGGAAIEAELHSPYEVRSDVAGDLFWVERLSHTVRKRDAKTGIVSTIAGTGAAGFSDGPGIKAQLNDPHSIAFDPHGDLYIADVKNHRIRKLDMKSGVVSTFAGIGEKKPATNGAPFVTSPLHGPRALDFDKEGNLWLALREGNAIFKLDLKKRTIHHIAGTGKKGFTGNGGPAKEATLNGPKGISVAPNGNESNASACNLAGQNVSHRAKPNRDAQRLCEDRVPGKESTESACRNSRSGEVNQRTLMQLLARDHTFFLPKSPSC